MEYILTAAGIAKETRGFGLIEMAGAFACAVTSYYLIEKPFLIFKRHFKPVAPQRKAVEPRAMTA
jgi:peptidoglycan/LPS O-acetylase OafA/YrhL